MDGAFIGLQANAVDSSPQSVGSMTSMRDTPSSLSAMHSSALPGPVLIIYSAPHTHVGWPIHDIGRHAAAVSQGAMQGHSFEKKRSCFIGASAEYITDIRCFVGERFALTTSVPIE